MHAGLAEHAQGAVASLRARVCVSVCLHQHMQTWCDWVRKGGPHRS